LEGLKEKLAESLEALRAQTDMTPRVGMILGTALGPVADNVAVETTISYEDIPHFQPSRVETHAGKLVFGQWAGVPVAVMKGRFHYYEGYSMQEVAYPAALMQALGVDVLIVTNAAGGADPRMVPGDLMVIDDHINLTWHNPLIGPNDDSMGARFPDMLDAYSPRLIELAEKSAAQLGTRLWRGTYMFIPGPSFETRAELRLLRKLGADVVGWSSVPEVVMAHYLGVEVLAFTCVTDMSIPDRLTAVDMDHLLAAGQRGAENLRAIIETLLSKI
jgi:purine-nucleoside phosphorylase